jgi:hypothetical protein
MKIRFVTGSATIRLQFGERADVLDEVHSHGVNDTQNWHLLRALRPVLGHVAGVEIKPLVGRIVSNIVGLPSWRMLRKIVPFAASMMIVFALKPATIASLLQPTSKCSGRT